MKRERNFDDEKGAIFFSPASNTNLPSLLFKIKKRLRKVRDGNGEKLRLSLISLSNDLSARRGKNGNWTVMWS